MIHSVQFRSFAAVLAIGASMAVVSQGDESPSCDVQRWEPAIAKFEKQDESDPPPKDAVLFVGSSSIVGWDVAKWFPDLPVINRGFGGSQLCHATHFVPRIVAKYQPRVIVLYSGDNDVAAGKPAERVHEDFTSFVAAVRKSFPETPIVFISIKPSIARWKLAESMRAANKLIEADCQAKDHLYFVDVWPTMLGDDGQPRKDIFRQDGLHMNDEGYKRWVDLLQPRLDSLLKNENHQGTKSTKDGD